MSLAMLLLMEYGLIGEKLHEWIGMAMFALFITHHILNRRWLCSITKGRYTLQRIVQTVTAVLILLCISGSMFSGIVISRYVFDFLKIRETLLAVKIHTIEGKNYEVAGVLSQMGTVSSGISPDSSIYVPYSTAEKYIFGNDTAPTITAVASDADKVETVMENINTLLTENYPQASFTLTDAGSAMEAANNSANTLQTLLIAAAVIVFIVGGIGIMNVLFVTVKERTKEIGILKALGSRRSVILLLFLLEASIIAIFGGAAGAAVGYALIPVVNKLGTTAVAVSYAGMLGAGFAVFTGTVFGFYPAFKASQLKPVEALSQE